jgi:hypothetical protein
MKKFSKITNIKVNNSPKNEIKINEEDLFKSKVMNLMDNYLTIRTYGPVDRYSRAGNIKVSGKEMFLEALMELLKDDSSKKEVKVLENLKSKISNWEVIDNEINVIKENVLTEDEIKKVILHKNNLNSLLEKFSQDKELLMNMVDESCKKIINKETAYYRGLGAKRMYEDTSKSLYLEISNKYFNRYNELK